MGELLRRIKSALGFDRHAGEASLEAQDADHQAALKKLEEQQRRLAAIDAGIASPRRRTETRGFRL